MTDTDLLIASQALELVANITPRIVPASTQTASSIGATSITVADTTGWLTGDLVTWWDGTDEAPLPILSITGSAVALDFTGQSYAGLQFVHASNTLVAVNLLDDMPLDTADMRKSGWPAINAFVVRGSIPGMEVEGSYKERTTLQMTYQIKSRQLRDGAMAEQLFQRGQTHRITREIRAIVNTLQQRNNRKLATPTRAQIVQALLSQRWGFTNITKTDSGFYYELALITEYAGGYSPIH